MAELIRLLRRPEVEKIVGLSRSGLYAAMARGDFPRPRRISRRAVGWDSSEIANWLAARPQADPSDVQAPMRGK